VLIQAGREAEAGENEISLCVLCAFAVQNLDLNRKGAKNAKRKLSILLISNLLDKIFLCPGVCMVNK
jgi:hypothetical protein